MDKYLPNGFCSFVDRSGQFTVGSINVNWAPICAWLCAKCFLCMISLNSHILIKKVRFLSLLPSGGKRDPERVGFLPKVTQETVTEASRSSRVSVADSPPPLTRLAPPIAALRGGAHPPRCLSVSRLSRCLRGCSGALRPSLRPRVGRGRR